MKKLLSILLLFALVALPGCGGVEGVITVSTTTEMETMVSKFDRILMETEYGLVIKRIIDIDYGSGYAQEIWLADNARFMGGTLLNYKPIALLLAERPNGTFPRFDAEIDSRYFAYHYGNPGTDNAGGMEFYDLKELRAVQVDCDGEAVVFDQLMDEKLYFLSHTEDGEIKSVFYVEIAALDSGGPVRAQKKAPPPLEETETLMETRDAVIFEKASGWVYYFPYQQEIWMRDKATGEETLLLENIDRAVPYFNDQINERYFIYHYGVPETCAVGDFEIYDIQKQRTVEIEHPEWVCIDRIDRRRIYLKTVNEYGEDDVIIKTYTIDIAALDGGGPIIPKKVR